MGEEYWFDVDRKSYMSIMQLVAAYQSGDDPILLQECLPPSEYGKFYYVCTLVTYI
jgi:hypothetical protein